MASVGSGRYDPELLKQDVHTAKLRVLSLRQELMQIRKEVSIKQQGLNTLAQVEQKMSTGSCYTMGEAQAIMNELRSIQRSLISGEKERMELMQCLARHKEDLTRLQSMTKFPDIGSSLGNSTEKLSTASQTDLSGDVSEHFFPFSTFSSTSSHYNIVWWWCTQKIKKETIGSLGNSLRYYKLTFSWIFFYYFYKKSTNSLLRLNT